MARNLTIQDIGWFLDLYGMGQLNLAHPFHRSRAWPLPEQQRFLDTIFCNYPSPPVWLHKTVNATGRGTYHVLDGRQRLRTIIAFTQGTIPLSENALDRRLPGPRWEDVDRHMREQFWTYLLPVELLPEMGEEFLRTLCARVQTPRATAVPDTVSHPGSALP
jgi:hypothetical protein